MTEAIGLEGLVRKEWAARFIVKITSWLVDQVVVKVNSTII